MKEYHLDDISNGLWRRIPEIDVTEFQSRTSFFDMVDMDQIALDTEVANLIKKYSNLPFMTFPEDRLYPMRLRLQLSKR